MNQIPSRITQHTPAKHGGKLAIDPNNHKFLIDFSSNTTPLRAPLALKKDNINYNISEYPDPASRKFITELSKYIHMKRSNIIAANGAIEIIYNVSFAFAQKGQILIPSPTFQEYETAIRLHHGNKRIIHFESMDMASDIDEFIKKITTTQNDNYTGMIFVCNPNNPTGRLLPRKHMKSILDAAATITSKPKKRKCHVIVDECFIELCSNPLASVLSFVPKYEHLIVVRSMTKSFGLAGIRLGYAIASDDVIDILYRVKVPWSVNNVASTIGAMALQNAKETLAKTRQFIHKESTYMQNRLADIDGIEYYHTDANFILLRTQIDSSTLQAKLIEKYRILVRDCSDFRGIHDNNHIRVAIKRHKDNVALLDALEDITKQ